MEPVSWIVIAGIAAGSVYLFIPLAMPWLQGRQGGLLWIIFIGLAFRLALMVPEPFYEIDFYRYLWDGAVINARHSPYDWSPRDILEGNAPKTLLLLSASAPGVIGQINYPHLTTIYPPVAEAVFALTSWLNPWDLTTWRLVILLFDLITLAMVCALLRHIGRPATWAIIYWWNPIIIVEFSNAAHMDVILLPFLIGSVLLAMKSRPLAGTACLSLAVAVKLWPALLLPTLLRAAPKYRTMLICIFVFSVTTGVLMWPFAEQAFQSGAGVSAFSTTWERNAALFRVIVGGNQTLLDTLGIYQLDAGKIARVMVTTMIAGIALCINVRKPLNDTLLVQRVIITISALLLLGPTLYPWYYAWLVPFLTVIPNRALLAFSVVLPLYRLQFHPWFLDHPHVFQNYVVWAEQGPVLIMLFFTWFRSRRTVTI